MKKEPIETMLVNNHNHLIAESEKNSKRLSDMLKHSLESRHEVDLINANSEEKMNSSNQRVELVKREVELQFLNRENTLMRMAAGGALVVCAAMWWALNK